MKKTKTIFKDIHSLEDIKKRKIRLDKKLRKIEKSFSDKTDFARLLLDANERMNSVFDGNNGKKEILGILLPLGIKYMFRLMQNIPDSKLTRRLIYTAIGGISAWIVYQYLNNMKKETGS